MPPALDVILPCYNAEQFLLKAVESVRRQTFSNFRLFAVNDGSRDKTGAILDSLARKDPRIHVIHQENSGQAQAMNRALGECSAEWIALMDADDISLPQRFERQLQHLRRNPDISVLGTGVMWIDEFGFKIGSTERLLGHAEIFSSLEKGMGGCITAPSAVLKRQMVQDCGGFRPQFSPVHDLDMFLRLGRVGVLANLPDVLFHYRKHPKASNYAGFAHMQNMIAQVLAEHRIEFVSRKSQWTNKTVEDYHKEMATIAVNKQFRFSGILHAILAFFHASSKSEGLRFLKYIFLRSL